MHILQIRMQQNIIWSLCSTTSCSLGHLGPRWPKHMRKLHNELTLILAGHDSKSRWCIYTLSSSLIWLPVCPVRLEWETPMLQGTVDQTQSTNSCYHLAILQSFFLFLFTIGHLWLSRPFFSFFFYSVLCNVRLGTIWISVAKSFWNWLVLEQIMGKPLLFDRDFISKYKSVD